MHKFKVFLVCSWYWWTICNPCMFVADVIIFICLDFGFTMVANVLSVLAVIVYSFFSFQILKGVPHRIEIYYRLSKLIQKYGKIKKSILYELKETLCESKVCDLICDENGIMLI